jgi:hypothetical protein
MDFKVSDGLTPSDKLINADTLQTAMQVIGSSPQIAAGYNLAPLFSYFIKTQGGRIQEFEKSAEQMAYEQALQQWSMMTQAHAESMKGLEPQQIQELMKQMPPQPVPQQFGYNPSQQGGAPGAGAAGAATGPAPKVNNITNNITNNRSGVQ